MVNQLAINDGLLIVTSLAFTAIVQHHFGLRGHYFLVSDCHKPFAVLIAVSSFLWFRNIDIKSRKAINRVGAATFGVLLIHANSNAMRS